MGNAKSSKSYFKSSFESLSNKNSNKNNGANLCNFKDKVNFEKGEIVLSNFHPYRVFDIIYSNNSFDGKTYLLLRYLPMVDKLTSDSLTSLELYLLHPDGHFYYYATIEETNKLSSYTVTRSSVSKFNIKDDYVGEKILTNPYYHYILNHLEKKHPNDKYYANVDFFDDLKENDMLACTSKNKFYVLKKGFKDGKKMVIVKECNKNSRFSHIYINICDNMFIYYCSKCRFLKKNKTILRIVYYRRKSLTGSRLISLYSDFIINKIVIDKELELKEKVIQPSAPIEPPKYSSDDKPVMEEPEIDINDKPLEVDDPPPYLEVQPPVENIVEPEVREVIEDIVHSVEDVVEPEVEDVIKPKINNRKLSELEDDKDALTMIL
jgi:hypothetical protein